METAYTAGFADGAYRFWLPMTRVIAAEREMGRSGAPRSIFELFYDIAEGVGYIEGRIVIAGPLAAKLAECHAVIRNALIGGNEGRVDGETIAVGDTLADELMETYCYPARPAMHDVALAFEILKAAANGIDTSNVKKKGEVTDDPPPS